MIRPHLAQINHVHVSENDRGTPGKGHVPLAMTFAALKEGGYDGWLTIEAFGRALPALAAATRVWRDFFPEREEVYRHGFTGDPGRLGGGLSQGGESSMKTIKGPAIFLAQFAGDAAPFNSLDSICEWAASLGYLGVQIPTWDSRLFNLERAAGSKDYCDLVRGTVEGHGLADHRAQHAPAGPAGRRASGL